MSESTPADELKSERFSAESNSLAILRLLDRPLSADDLRVGTELASLPAEQARGQSVRLLLFRIGEERASLPAKLLRRVTPAIRPRPIPHRSGHILRGVCNIRGEIVLCADLHRLLGLPARTGDAVGAGRMIVIGSAENSWAFEVDELVGIENIDSANVREPPVTVAYALHDFTQGVTDIGGQCVTILDGERILAGFKAGLA